MSDENKWLDQLGTSEVREDTIDQEGLSFPYAQWVNGDQALRRLGIEDVTYTGGWFIPADRLPLDTLPGWTHGVLAHRDGSETEGWFAKSLCFAMMHYRRCWQVAIGGQTVNYPWKQYDQAEAAGAAAVPTSSPRARLQLLGFIRGLEAVGPMVLTMKGTTGMAFTANEGILAQHRLWVLKAAAALSSKNNKRRITAYPRFYFWMPVASEADAKGQPVFTKAGSGELSRLVTRPVLVGVTKGMTAQELGQLYVGQELITTIEGSRDPVTGQWNRDGAFDETADWARAWDRFGQAEVTTAPATAVADDSPLEDEPLPF